MKKFAIVLIVIGNTHQNIYNILKVQFEQYAKKCHADLIICNDYIDKTRKESIVMQKMLIGSEFSKYDWILFLDLDIIINKNSPSIFEIVDDNIGLYGNLEPVGTAYYNEVCKYLYRRHDMCTNDQNAISNDNSIIVRNIKYLTENGFPTESKMGGRINGGSFLINPSKVANMFKEYYYNYTYTYFNKKIVITDQIAEEIPMTYISKINNIFCEMDKKYNYQIAYPLFGSKLFNTEDINWRNHIYNNKYYEFIKEKVAKNYFCHFSAGLHMPIIHYKDDEIIKLIFD